MSRSLIPFTKPFYFPACEANVAKVFNELKPASGNNYFSYKSQDILEQMFGKMVLITPSCTAALEMAALALDLGPEDEVIVPSYTFTSTANAFALRGVTIKFADIDETGNITLENIKVKLTTRTRCVVVVHYGGVAAANIVEISEEMRRMGIFVVEDVAQGFDLSVNGKMVGTFGDFGALSFHDTKNIPCGEGGALIVSNPKYQDLIHLIQEKGTDRHKQKSGLISKYKWQTLGSSYVVSEFTAAIICGQLAQARAFKEKRKKIIRRYHELLNSLSQFKTFQIPFCSDCNGHMFYLLADSLEVRDKVVRVLTSNNITAVSHYELLDESPFLNPSKEKRSDLSNSRKMADGIIRLPLFFELSEDSQDYICDQVKKIDEALYNNRLV